MKERIKVLICDDITILTKRYINLLSKTPDIEVVGTASSGYEAVMKTALLKPNIILMDVEMESRNAGIMATRQIIGQFPYIKIIMLTVYENAETIYEAFKAGVVGYCLKDSPFESILQSIKGAYEGNVPIHPDIADKLRQEYVRVSKMNDSLLGLFNNLLQLSPTEFDILNLLIQGKTRYEICSIRVVEMSTVKSQINSILKKMCGETTGEIIATLKALNLIDFVTNIRPSQQ